MAQAHFHIGVVMARSQSRGPWGRENWLPVSVLPDVPGLAVGAPLDPPHGHLFYAGAVDLEFHAGQTGHYRDNLISGWPAIWVALNVSGEGATVRAATADPYEGESMAEGVGKLVEALVMPAALCALLASFVERHHVERPFIKRQRDRLGRREQGSE